MINQGYRNNWSGFEDYQVGGSKDRASNSRVLGKDYLDVGLSNRVNNEEEVLGAVGGHWEPKSASNSYLN